MGPAIGRDSLAHGRQLCRRLMYVLFLVTWGLNYRRVSLEDKLGVDYRAVTPDAAAALAEVAARELNQLYAERTLGRARRCGLDASLAQAFAAATRARLGHSVLAVPARPKQRSSTSTSARRRSTG